MKYLNKNPQNVKEIEKERFEFELTVNGNMICQRYFNIGSFKDISFYSLDFYDAANECVSLIKESLQKKARTYTTHMAPLIFNNEKEMRTFLFNEDNTPNVEHTKSISFGSHIILREANSHEYVWLGHTLQDEGIRNEDEYTEFISPLGEEVTFKFAIIDNGPDYIRRPQHKERFSAVWNGNVYPKFIRNAVDLSNGKRNKNNDITSMSHEMSIHYWSNLGQVDLIPIIIQNIREVCSYENVEDYRTKMVYGSATYDNVPAFFKDPKPEETARYYGYRKRY